MPADNVIYLDSLTELQRVLGKKTGERLQELGLYTLDDLAHYYPRRYNRRGELSALSEGEAGEYLTYVAQLKDREQRRVKNNTLLLTVLTFTDGVTDLTCTFFSKSRFTVNPVVRDLQMGDTAVITGTVHYRNIGGVMRRELIHPKVDPYEEVRGNLEDEDGSPFVIYPTIKGVHNALIVGAVKTALGPMTREELPDPVPADVREKHGLLPLYDAIMKAHFPETIEDTEEAGRTLRFHEAFIMQAELARRRTWADRYAAIPRLSKDGGFVDALDAHLPFDLTKGQEEVAAQIRADLERNKPMRRLLQGEVGSGKTVVALRAMLQVVDAGAQAALLAPTEVLAAQHLRSIEATLGDLAPKVGLTLLTGSQSAGERREALEHAASGEAGIVIGTHALLEDNVEFKDLGFIVIDEQHRFGVEQRDALRTKADHSPHVLVMTATPIPRSIAMTVFGDVDTSELREIPAGRSPITTHVVWKHNKPWMDRIWERIAEEVRTGGRAYVVSPRIDHSGPDDTGTTVLSLADSMSREPALAGISMRVMHGRLSAQEKDSAMAEFISGESPVLISTTVIEVGVDVPEASVMVIMDAHMFGFSQLHQLRGRIGRGNRPGLCLVVTGDESAAVGKLTKFAETTDGFELADLDLEMRREGDVLGRAQSGTGVKLRYLKVMKHRELIEEARAVVWPIVEADPELTDHPALERAIRRVSRDADYLDRV